jgi:hypothetical protein
MERGVRTTAAQRFPGNPPTRVRVRGWEYIRAGGKGQEG